MKLAGLGGVVLVSGCASTTGAAGPAADPNSISCSSRTPTGGSRAPDINPDAKGTLKKAVAAVNALSRASPIS